MNQTGAKQGLIPIPEPMPIPAPNPLPAASPLPQPMLIQAAGVLPPLMGTATTSTVPVPALARSLGAGEPMPVQNPQGVMPPRGRRTALRMMGLPRPGEFWAGTPNIPTNLPSPEDQWRGTITTSQIYLPTPEEFWGE